MLARSILAFYQLSPSFIGHSNCILPFSILICQIKFYIGLSSLVLFFTGLFSPDQMLDDPVIVHLAQSFFGCALFYGPYNLQVLLIKSFAGLFGILLANSILYWLVPSFSGQSHPLLASPILYCLDQSFTLSFSIILDNHFTGLSSLIHDNPILYWQIQVETIFSVLYCQIQSYWFVRFLLLSVS
jgi:hypothetical protein